LVKCRLLRLGAVWIEEFRRACGLPLLIPPANLFDIVQTHAIGLLAMSNKRTLAALYFLLTVVCLCGNAQTSLVVSSGLPATSDFRIAQKGSASAIYVEPGSPETVVVAAEAFASDVEEVTGSKPQMLSSLDGRRPSQLILIGVLGHAPEIDRLVASGKLDVTQVAGKWEAAVTAVVDTPMTGVKRALVIAGADRRGAAYALFTLSRQMGVSPWTWWADVPVAPRAAVYARGGTHVQASPSVQYRGIFLNDEDWGLRPWAAKKMDPTVDGGKGNIGPHTYERIFELLLRLHANSLWPAMHPGSLAFNAVPENAILADKWSIVMGSSHSEALLRNNVGEWNEKTDGPWNYQKNAAAINAYWDQRLKQNGGYENFYTVGLRGVHDSGLEATGSPEVKAKLVEDVMTEQRRLLAARVNADVAKVPQILWLYKESLDLYRVGMKVPDDVTLGWTDDNYGYIRQLPNAVEQQRAGGSGVYYHVSYWGSPHDYLWLCTTPPSLIQEEMTKAYDHNARRYWILNVGDLKPAEMDIDYFMQLAVDEPRLAKVSQQQFLKEWFGEQFPSANAASIANVMTQYYALNFIRKPEFMGFNGYNDGVRRTDFNPLAWGVDGGGNENASRQRSWARLSEAATTIGRTMPQRYAAAFYELVGYPVQASAAMNEKILSTDLTYLDAHNGNGDALRDDAARAHDAYASIQKLTAGYNALDGGKWDGILSAAPRERHVFDMPQVASMADAEKPMPTAWGAGDAECSKNKNIHAVGSIEQHCTISIEAAHFVRSSNAGSASDYGWHVLKDLGISGDSVEYGSPGLSNDPSTQVASPKDAPWLEYEFTTSSTGPATLALHLLPTFALDSEHRLRYAVSVDGGEPKERDAAAGASTKAAGAGDGASGAGWPQNVLRNSAIETIPLGVLTPGRHTLRLIHRDAGVVYEHLVISFPGAPPAYPVPPETRAQPATRKAQSQ
jgi:hypothetical protein